MGDNKNLPNLKDEKQKQLFEARMNNPGKFSSPPPQQANIKSANSSTSKVDEDTGSTVAEIPTASSALKESSLANKINISSTENDDIVAVENNPSNDHLVTPAVALNNSISIPLMCDEDSKASNTSRSQIRYSTSPNLKEKDKDKENRAEQGNKKRQSSGKIDDKSPKQVKQEDNALIDQTSINHDTGSRGASVAKGKTLDCYFQPQGSNNLSGVSVGLPTPSAPSSSSSSIRIGSSSSHSEGSEVSGAFNAGISPPTMNRKDIQKNSVSYQGSGKSSSTVTLPTAATAASVVSPEIKKQLEMARITKQQLEQAESKIMRTEADLKASQNKFHQLEEKNIRLCKCLEEIHRASAVLDARKRRDKLALDCVRLGKIVPVRMSPTNIQDVWEEGYALNELKRRGAELLEKKDEFEKRRKKLQNAKRAAKKGEKGYVGGSNNGLMGAPEDEEPYELDLDLATEAEAIKTHLELLKRDEGGLLEEKRMLEGEKAAHQKEIKRCQFEDKSRFKKDLPCLNSRYLLLSMLGKGGFSEVWKALDLSELREVAVKVHQLNTSWSEEHKHRYIKNVTREYEIHREMRHPRVVDFYDVFEIDKDSFATVLEYCKGIDLDEKLKRCKILPEREARTVLMQIISGLRYLNTPADSTSGNGISLGDEDGGEVPVGGGGGSRRKAIIHYDLKPANILFDEMGDAKITDFGLSKIIEESQEGTSMELTSQGAGTYWYLPPECFASGDARISSKVDVWSVGVIFYQMLFGKRPFGEGKSQERVLSEGIILNAKQVEFPSSSDGRSPKIPDEAKDLIRACLTSDQKYRPDVHTLCQHAYLKNGK